MPPKPNVEEQRRQATIAAAVECFSKRGYYATKMDDVAAAAGMSKALIYYYFKNKQQLFLAVLDAWLAGFDSALTLIDPAASASVKLRRLGQISVEMSEGATEVMTLLFEFWAHASREPTLMGEIGKTIRRYREWVAEVIEDGIRNGEFRTIDPALTAVWLFAALDGLLAHWILDERAFSLRAAMESLLENLLRALKKTKGDHE